MPEQQSKNIVYFSKNRIVKVKGRPDIDNNIENLVFKSKLSDYVPYDSTNNNQNYEDDRDSIQDAP